MSNNRGPVVVVDDTNTGRSISFNDGDTYLQYEQIFQDRSQDETIPYFEINQYSDAFYKDIEKEINVCYINSAYVAQSILQRKMLENLIIDIFRKRYGPKEKIDLYYNVKINRLKSFWHIIRSMEKKKNYFKTIIPNFDDSLIKELKKFKEVGDGSAHSISSIVTEQYINENKDTFIQTVKILLRLFNQIPPYVVQEKEEVTIMPDDILEMSRKFFYKE